MPAGGNGVVRFTMPSSPIPRLCCLPQTLTLRGGAGLADYAHGWEEGPRQ